MKKQIVVSYCLFCDCAEWVGYCNSRREAYQEALSKGWKRVRGVGWVCNYCLQVKKG